jgi:hypothetical protein
VVQKGTDGGPEEGTTLETSRLSKLFRSARY